MRLALALDGPFVGVATLQAWCPSVSRRAIAAWRRQRRHRDRARLHVVHWTRPGRIWAADFSDAPQPIDGDYRCVLHVRDLASQQYLAALPVPRPTATAGVRFAARALGHASRAAGPQSRQRRGVW